MSNNQMTAIIPSTSSSSSSSFSSSQDTLISYILETKLPADIAEYIQEFISDSIVIAKIQLVVRTQRFDHAPELFRMALCVRRPGIALVLTDRLAACRRSTYSCLEQALRMNAPIATTILQRYRYNSHDIQRACDQFRHSCKMYTHLASTLIKIRRSIAARDRQQQRRQRRRASNLRSLQRTRQVDQ